MNDLIRMDLPGGSEYFLRLRKIDEGRFILTAASPRKTLDEALITGEVIECMASLVAGFFDESDGPDSQGADHVRAAMSFMDLAVETFPELGIVYGVMTGDADGGVN